VILAVSLLNIFENYYFDKKKEALIEEGRKLNYIVIKYLNREVTYERLRLELEAIERFLNTKIWVVDRYGFVYGVSNESEKQWIGKQINKNEVVEVLNGNIISKEGQYDEVFGTPVLTVGVPIFINGEVRTGVFMHSPIYEIKETINEVYRLILLSIVISLAVVIIPLYVISQRISKPLSEINQITKIIASGEFHKRVSVASKDEIGQLAESFNYMAEELEKIEETRKSFIANLSHELRSPLTLIRGYIKGMLDMKLTEEKKKEYLNIIYEETEKLTELINNLLDLSKMESGQYPLNIGKFNINELIRRNIIKYGTRFEQKDIQVRVNFEDDPIFVKADKDSISQVISNIIDNAVKFTNSEGKIIFKTETKEGKAYISIEDTGIGIPKNELKDIWKRFYKGDKSRSRQVKGTGLGLSIVKEIIKGHNQEIWVESEPGKGTKFTFTLETCKPSK
jgi:signal transduction histidine kinase